VVPPSTPATPVAKPVELASGESSISCELDYAEHGDGEPLRRIDRRSLERAMRPCVEAGVVRLRYRGKVRGDFVALVDGVAESAGKLGIGKRILDLHSSGGRVEDAIAAGDALGDSGWTIWVREDAQCNSACVLVLAAGDYRLISGSVGIHRVIRIGTSADTRAELQQELREVRGLIEQHLVRHGAATAIADLMMTVPNRNLRRLSPGDLRRYGLDGVNAAQDDLDRLRLTRKCGEPFVRRADAFHRAFDAECKRPQRDLDAIYSCGMGLRQRFDFPDAGCPQDSPMRELDEPPSRATEPGGRRAQPRARPRP